MKSMAAIFGVLLVGGCFSSLATHNYKLVPGEFEVSKWAREVSPENVLPEYPRPMMEREEWINLNGLWDYAVLLRESEKPETYAGKILVPFCIEAPLSGVGKTISSFPGMSNQDSHIWYRRSFHLPSAWKEKRLILHFGAVDWETSVYVNGKEIGSHKGGYDAFSFDITEAIKEGDNELVISVWDSTDSQARGKQVIDPKGITYTSCSGIWQTVWIEPVPTQSIERFKVVPNIDEGWAEVTVTARGGAEGNVTITALNGNTEAARAKGAAGHPIRLEIKDAKLWWPNRPFLYDLVIELVADPQRDGHKAVDRVTGYFGMRKSSIGKDAGGKMRVLLNNKFIFHHGLLDQGYWPGGNYTAPTDEALRYDIEMTKKLGFNMARKHLKVEPERWYYWADKLGLLVWQDMPNCGGEGRTPEIREQFMHELERMIEGKFNHPSIVSWVLFNEGMGLKGFDLKAVTDTAMQLDPTRLIDHESGAGGYANQGANKHDIGEGHIVDFHCYKTLNVPAPDDTRAAIVGEYGYAPYLETVHKYAPKVESPGISGLVWTQTTSVENEKNGLMNYNRTAFTEDAEKIISENKRLFGKYLDH